MENKIQNVEVLIIGGGVSGTMAAISSARMGANTVLVERGGCLGGMWTSGLIGKTLDYEKNNKLLVEFLSRVKEEMSIGSATLFETQKYLLEKMCLEAGVKVYLYSQFSNLNMDEGIISSVSIVNKSGTITFNPKVVIDATGDGDIAFNAGCSFDYGRDSDGKTQPMSMCALLTGFDERAEKYLGWDNKDNFEEIIDSVDIPHSLGMISLQECGDGIFQLSINQEYEMNGIDVCDLTKATLNARNEVYNFVRDMRTKLSHLFSNVVLIATPELMGVREGRRIHCKYTVTLDDMVNGKKHPDAVCKCNYWVDIHSVTNDGGSGVSEEEDIRVKSYDIPYRSMLPIGVKNLLVSGRCISGDFYAHASYRTMGNMAPVGEAAGMAAAISVKENIQLDKVELSINL